MQKLSYKDWQRSEYPPNYAIEFIAYANGKNLSDKEYLITFLASLNILMINGHCIELIPLGYMPLLPKLIELCKKFELLEMSYWLNGIRLSYEQFKTHYDKYTFNMDPDYLLDYSSWYKDYDAEYFTLVPPVT